MMRNQLMTISDSLVSDGVYRIRDENNPPTDSDNRSKESCASLIHG